MGSRAPSAYAVSFCLLIICSEEILGVYSVQLKEIADIRAGGQVI